MGGGLAGLSAAVEARRTSDVHVELVDKEPCLGGSSRLACDGISVLVAPADGGLSARIWPADGYELFVEDALRAGAGLADEALLRMLVVSPTARCPSFQPRARDGVLCFACCRRLSHAIHRLASSASHSHRPFTPGLPPPQRQSANVPAFVHSLGVRLGAAVRAPGHCRTRTLRPVEAVHSTERTLISALKDALRADPSVRVHTGVRVVDLLLRSDGSVRGVAAERTGVPAAADAVASECGSGVAQSLLVIDADAVILATGGFAASGSALLRSQRPRPGLHAQHAWTVRDW